MSNIVTLTADEFAAAIEHEDQLDPDRSIKGLKATYGDLEEYALSAEYVVEVHVAKRTRGTKVVGMAAYIEGLDDLIHLTNRFGTQQIVDMEMRENGNVIIDYHFD